MSKQKDDLDKQLLRACKDGDEKKVQELISQGAIVNAKDKNEWTPLHIGCFNDAVKVVQILIEAGANVNAKDQYEETPLHFACNNNNFDLVKMLINSGANVNVKNEAEETPLHYACQNDNFELVEILLEQEAKVNAKDKYEKTPLYNACKCNEPKTVKILLDFEAEITDEMINLLNNKFNQVLNNPYLLLSVNTKVDKVLGVCSYLARSNQEGVSEKVDLENKTLGAIQTLINIPENRFSQEKKLKIIEDIVKVVPYFIDSNGNDIINDFLKTHFNLQIIEKLENCRGDYLKEQFYKKAPEYLPELKSKQEVENIPNNIKRSSDIQKEKNKKRPLHGGYENIIKKHKTETKDKNAGISPGR